MCNVAAAWSLSGFVPERLPLHRTVAAQVAGNFATLVSPPTIGSIAINVRFLQKSGLHPALAAASVGVSQVMAFVSHIALLFVFGIAAGTTAQHTFDPPRWAVIAVVILVDVVEVVIHTHGGFLQPQDGRRSASEPPVELTVRTTGPAV